ncbi:hypothetical protein C6N75_11220 [Streptomyces solincola]|uniref:DNA/RNA non-specific endonuclease n=1 Tax=Streptomyces solincola TaxID=2100817 RepID=A0A2S9PXQ3_9ACTN|nr:hypothetical protein C6N75_11220 [Streptomyces solincola]
MTSRESCEPTVAGSRERRAGAVKACVTVSAKPAPTTAPRSRTAQRAAADSATCDITDPGKFWYSRHGYCAHGLTVLYTLRDTNGRTLGTGTLDVSTSATLPARGDTWKELVVVTMTGTTGSVKSLDVRFRVSCSAGCTARKDMPFVKKTMVTDQVVSGPTQYESAPAPGAQADFTTSYTMYVSSPGAQITDATASWSSPEKIRCDDAVRDLASTTAPDRGCVMPHVMPVVTMSDQQTAPGAGAAAAGYLWAQNSLAGGWGRATPLTRAKNGTADRAARSCAGFQVRTDLVPTDTCDSFPFSSTHEGGADAAECAEVVPTRGSSGWNVHVLKDAANKRCARAHVPDADQRAAESRLAAGYAEERILESEAFKVEISGSVTEPLADCRSNMPSSGVQQLTHGWIRNTTAPVPHTNKTTSPLGPPGVRAALAQVCLGPGKHEQGSPAAGDITGWQDAQEFNRLHPPTTGLARCHLIPNVIGGKGNDNPVGASNLVPCWQYGMNTGSPSMRSYEAVLANAVAEPSAGGILGPNDAVLYQVTPTYLDATSTIPHGVTITGTIQRADGTSQPLFPDVYVTNTRGPTGTLNMGN